jgi:hypothetical protein
MLLGELKKEDIRLLFESLPRSKHSLIVLSLDIDGVSNDSQDPLEQNILQAFIEHCHNEQLKMRVAHGQLNDALSDKLNSFIVH